MSWIVDHGIEILFVFLAIMTGAALHFFRQVVGLERELGESSKQIAWKGEEWHALNEEMLITLGERDDYKAALEQKQIQVSALMDNVARKRGIIHRHRIDCQVARMQLRKMCNAPSEMWQLLDTLERQFKPNAN